jgi:hypothetical protein
MKRMRLLGALAAGALGIVTVAFVSPSAEGRPSVNISDRPVNASSTGLPPTQLQVWPSIAMNPTNPLNLVVGAWDWTDMPACTDSTPSACPGDPYDGTMVPVSSQGFYASFDGGRTFPCHGLIDLSSFGVYPRFDPWVTFDGSGTAYYATVAYPSPDGLGNGLGGSMFVARSTDGGCTWGSASKVAGPAYGQILAPVNVAADTHPTSPFRDTVYASWTEFGGWHDHLMFSHSTDGGATWSKPVLIRRANDQPNGFTFLQLIKVAPNGTVYVMWMDNAGLGKSPVLKISISYDGGETFPVKGLAAVAYDTEQNVFVDSLPGTDFLVWDGPDFSVAPDGTLYAAFPRRTNDHTVVMLAKSTDGGLTWPEPVVAADVAGRSVFMVALAVDPKGRVNVAFTALDDVPPGTPIGAGVVTYDTYWTQSIDGGTSFTSPRKISSAPSDPDARISTRFFPHISSDISCNCLQWTEDILSAVADSSHVYVAWTDTRNSATCKAMDDYLLGLGPAPDLITQCPPNWNNPDIYLGTVSY